MAGDTPDLDWLANDLYYDLFTSVLTLDALVPRGSPSADLCGCCATRLRGRNRRGHVSAGRSRVYRWCRRCDGSPSDVRLPEGWT